MQLRELIKKIRAEKRWTQTQMGAALKIAQQDVQGMENAGRNLEKQFSVFLRLIEVCRDLRINPAQELLPPTPEEVIDNAQQDGSPTRGDGHRGKSRTKKKGHRAVQARGAKGN